MRILLVEDEKPLSRAICASLAREAFTVDPVYTGPDGLEAAKTGEYDAVILDVMPPGMDGFTVLEHLRAGGVSTPVLILTARGDVDDRVRGLEGGADYYLSKPLQTPELIACLRAITRRKSDKPLMCLCFGDIELQQESVSLLCARTGQSVRLGAKEYQLLELFLRNPRQVLPRETIVERVWGFDNEAEYNNLAVYLSFVRRKLQFVGSTVEIRATRGVGYALEEDACSKR